MPENLLLNTGLKNAVYLQLRYNFIRLMEMLSVAYGGRQKNLHKVMTVGMAEYYDQ